MITCDCLENGIMFSLNICKTESHFEPVTAQDLCKELQFIQDNSLPLSCLLCLRLLQFIVMYFDLIIHLQQECAMSVCHGELYLRCEQLGKKEHSWTTF